LTDHSQRAKELFLQGHNCSQAVIAAFCEELDLDFETALKLSSSFGAGMGRLREVCGAVSGMFMIAGMKYGYTDPKDNKAKAEHYKLVQELAEQFKKSNGSIVCRELLSMNESPGANNGPGVSKGPGMNENPGISHPDFSKGLSISNSDITKGPDDPTPEARTPQYYKKRPCAVLVADAAKIIEDAIKMKEQP